VGKWQDFGGICCLHVEGGKIKHVGKSTKMLDRECKAKNKTAGRVQPDKSVTIKSILYYNAKKNLWTY
jgi:hypothetical protein